MRSSSPKKFKQKKEKLQPPSKLLFTESTASGNPSSDSAQVIPIKGLNSKNQDKRVPQQKEETLKKHVEEHLNKLEESKGFDNSESSLNLLGKRFRICDELVGMGSFGRTHIGIDIKKDKSVAIKIV